MKKKELLIISVGIFLTIAAWMIIDLYHIKTNSLIQTEIKPAEQYDYKLDKSVLEILKEKK